MLVYANNFVANGESAKQEVLRAVGGWLKEQLGYGLHPDQLTSRGEHKGEKDKSGSWVKVLAATGGEQQLFSWVLKNPDASVRGRQWVTEIGLKELGNSVQISCVVSTEESSTFVLEPVKASRPRLIRYIASNIEASLDANLDGSVPGLSVKGVGSNRESFRGLEFDIESSERDYPIVLVSPDRNGSYLVNSEHLQQDLVGLAQVVKVDPSFDSRLMEEVLGRRWSAWDGAINILHMPTQSGYIRSKVFFQEEISGWGKTQYDRISQILAWVTHNTNIPRLRKRIRPEGVMSLAIRQSLEETKKKQNALNELEVREELRKLTQAAEEQNQWVELLEETNGNLEQDLQQVKLELDDKAQELARKKSAVLALKDQLSDSGTATSSIDAEFLIKMISRSDVPEPYECLDLIESVYGNYCEILDSAKESAKESNRFAHSRQLLDLLIRLVTAYRETLINKGDSEARKVFGHSEFAARESETVMNNDELRRAREFLYQGNPVGMYRHLKIGVVDNPERTIRVHFHWDHSRQKIIVGYCGEHLPVPSH